MIDVAGVDHQYLVLQVCGLAFVKEPQGAGQAAGVEELVANGHHHVDMAGLHQLLADVAVLVAGVRRTGGHHEAGAAALVQIGIEVLDPQAVGVADGSGLAVQPGQAEGQAAVLVHLRLDLLGVHPVHVEGGIGHHVVAVADQLFDLVIEGVALAQVAGVQSVHHHVHPGQAGVGVALFLAVEDHAGVGVGVADIFNEVAGLHEHAG